MPIYEFQCEECGTKREELLKTTELDIVHIMCTCNQKPMKKLVSPANPIWKYGSPTPKFHSRS